MIGYNRSPHSRLPPVTASWLLPAVTAPGTASLHLLLALQARPLYSLTLVHPFFLASSSEAAVFLFLTERMRLSLSPHPQNSLIALSACALTVDQAKTERTRRNRRQKKGSSKLRAQGDQNWST